jgi:hypothetical protein
LDLFWEATLRPRVRGERGVVGDGDDVRVRLELLDEKRFGSGVVHLHYRVVPA